VQESLIEATTTTIAPHPPDPGLGLVSETPLCSGASTTGLGPLQTYPVALWMSGDSWYAHVGGCSYRVEADSLRPIGDPGGIIVSSRDYEAYLFIQTPATATADAGWQVQRLSPGYPSESAIPTGVTLQSSSAPLSVLRGGYSVAYSYTSSGVYQQQLIDLNTGRLAKHWCSDFRPDLANGEPQSINGALICGIGSSLVRVAGDSVLWESDFGNPRWLDLVGSEHVMLKWGYAYPSHDAIYARADEQFYEIDLESGAKRAVTEASIPLVADNWGPGFVPPIQGADLISVVGDRYIILNNGFLAEVTRSGHEVWSTPEPPGSVSVAEGDGFVVVVIGQTLYLIS
jgi:hypothetical protein